MPILTGHELLSAAHRLGAVTEGNKEGQATWAPQLHLWKRKLFVHRANNLSDTKLRFLVFEVILIIFNIQIG